MTPDRNNFYFRHTKGDAVSERAVKMLCKGYEGAYSFYGMQNGAANCDDVPFHSTSYEVSPAEAIRLMEGGEVWEPKHFEQIEWKNNAFDWQTGKYGCPHLDEEGHVIFNNEGNMMYARSIRPIQPAPPTAEQELTDVLKNLIVNTNFIVIKEDIDSIMDWHNRWALARAKGNSNNKDNHPQ